MSSRFAHWKLGFIAAAIVVVVTSIPQLGVIIKRGTAWEGSYAILDFDEVSYSAYLNALIQGRPRKNNPYLTNKGESAHESLFSIQFIPPYLIAIPARAVGISTSTAFILLVPLMALISSLTIFWLLYQITRNETISAIGVLIVLLCGRLISENPFSSEQIYSSFSFLRRYIPALPFPVFFLFCGFAGRAFVEKSKSKAFIAGLFLSLLIYSYFYLWTAAAAWFFCFVIAWIVARTEDRWPILKCTSIVAGVAICALIPYFYLLSLRSRTLDAEQVLVHTRAPDLFRVTEIVGFLLLAILIVKICRRRLDYRAPEILFLIACAVTPLIVFNQQVVTGLSLQSFHYEQFIVNYLVLVGVVATYHLVWAHVKIRPILWAALAICVGVATALKEVRDHIDLNVRRDEAKPVFERLDQLGVTSVTAFNNSLLASSALTDSSAPQLWAPSMHYFGEIVEKERIERHFQYLYLLGEDPQMFEDDLLNVSQIRASVFGLHRVNPTLSQKFVPVTDEEIRSEVTRYTAFVENFSAQQASKWPLSYVVMVNDASQDFPHLDRWYVKGAGEKVGNCTIYPVKLKPQP